MIDHVYEDLACAQPTSVSADMLRDSLRASFVGVQMLVGATRDQFSYILNAGFTPRPRVQDQIVTLSKNAARGSAWSIELPACGHSSQSIDLYQLLRGNPREANLRDYFAELGIRHMMLATCYRDEDWRYLFFATRAPGQEPFSKDESATLAHVVPHFRTAFRARTRFLTANAMNRCLSMGLDQLGVGVAIVDRDGEVIEMSMVAERILARKDGLLHNRRLRAAWAGDDRRLQDMIQKLGGADGHNRPRAISLWRPSGRPRLEILIDSLRAGGRPSGAGAVVYMRDRDAASSLAPHALQGLFGLTEAEAHVCVRLAEGLTPHMICETTGISYNTVRAHLRSVFAKCEVESQAELMRLIINSPACIALQPGAVAATAAYRKARPGRASIHSRA